MNKRQFLATAALSATLPLHAATKANASQGPTLLTLTGAITKANRGPLDPALDQMMYKQKLAFDKALTLTFADLLALPATTIRPTLEYDGKPHTLTGPLLTDVLRLAGSTTDDAATIYLRAIDGYAVAPTLAEVRKYRFILATHIDGKPMALGSLGPLWAVYDADHLPEFANRPLKERFALCPWGIYHVDVKNA
ncbi:MAG: molybdopterin-dependent oxidoreductase [Burkholderiales bacterium]|nr:molybdopterin-dependent oxidoreductase [Burkholderiales bacterium]